MDCTNSHEEDQFVEEQCQNDLTHDQQVLRRQQLQCYLAFVELSVDMEYAEWTPRKQMQKLQKEQSQKNSMNKKESMKKKPESPGKKEIMQNDDETGLEQMVAQSNTLSKISPKNLQLWSLMRY